MSSPTDHVWPHLSSLPQFRALIRAIEHRLLDDYKPFARPILDVGCGDGHFGAAALDGRVDVGIDLAASSLREARARRAYAHLVRADAPALPFRSETFGTVIANCAIEHIPDLRSTLGEIRRTLRPDGVLLLTVPTDRLERNFIIPRVLRRLGAGAAAGRYVAWFRAKQVHHHLYSREGWRAVLEEAGLRVAHLRGYMSARATARFELMHYAGLMNLACRQLTGYWVLWPWRPRFFLAERRLARFVAEPEHDDDSDLFIVATR